MSTKLIHNVSPVRKSKVVYRFIPPTPLRVDQWVFSTDLIKIFIQTLQLTSEPEKKPEISLEIATAVLLFEVINADHKITPQEHANMASILEKRFNLSAQEIVEIIAIAEIESKDASDFYKYTSLLNERLPLQERIKIVEVLWQLAYADDHLDVIEEHIIRRIADLLHLRHQEFIQCKLKAQQRV